ncbi:cold-shock protein [Streptomyces sp. NPDC101206]|uniref:cold-shock protein n=1 Tax=Streptomyces sp. NPDC101206 TaxID=3366128 RepID=UPI0037F56E48
MATGAVRSFDDEKGFGWITPEGGGDDLLAPSGEIRVDGSKTLQEDQRVEFEVRTGPKGMQAVNIRPL